MITNENNLIIEFSDEVTFENITKDDFHITIESDS